MPEEQGERFVARPSRARLALMLAGSLLFVVASLWMAGAFGEPPNPRRAWIGWVGAPLFSLFGVIAALRMRETADQILIDARGFTWRHWSDDHIPWDAVAAVEERRIHGQVMFPIFLREGAAHPPTRLVGRLAAAQRGMGMGDFSLTATGTDRKADELRDALNRFAPGGVR